MNVNRNSREANLERLRRIPAAKVNLAQDEVHVWWAALDQEGSVVDRLQSTLSEDELNRAGRFHFRRGREHFAVARGLLRTLLGAYLGVEPEQLRFWYTNHGKPLLSYPSIGCRLRFNLSHSSGLVLYALTWGREIGVDLERLRPIPEAEHIAARFFSAPESAVFRALPAGQKERAFFNCWTRKEAYIKAIGDGLSRPLDRFEVSLVPGEPARLLSVEGHADETSRWCVRELTPIPGYVAALAVEGHGWHLTHWGWLNVSFQTRHGDLYRQSETERSCREAC